MYVYMREGWFHSFGVLGFWLVVGCDVCGGLVGFALEAWWVVFVFYVWLEVHHCR